MISQEQFSKVIEETAKEWMDEFHNIVGGNFERGRWNGHCANWFKKALLPLIAGHKEEPVAETGKPKGRFGSTKAR